MGLGSVLEVAENGEIGIQWMIFGISGDSFLIHILEIFMDLYSDKGKAETPGT